MTTIAVDKTHIAWDSLVILGESEKMTCHYEKARVDGKTIYAASGNVDIEALIEWAKNIDEIRTPKGTWELLIIDCKGVRHANNDSPTFVRIMSPIAIGSGAQYARGAMMAGASAFKAVEIAAMCDAMTGGEIKELKIESVVKPKRIILNKKRKTPKPRSPRCR